MTIREYDDGLSERGMRDARRHREKVKEAIRENLPDIIGEESIITRKRGRKVRVPIRGLKSYRFRFDRGSGRGAFGQGEGRKGDVIGRRRRDGKPGEEAGDKPGIDYLETEIDIEELIEMMFEDLGLPNLRQKEKREAVIPRGWTFDSVERHGLQTHLDKRRTVKEAIRRRAGFIRELMEQTGASRETCSRALDLTGDDIEAARERIARGRVCAPDGKGEAKSPPLFSQDLRYRTLSEDIEHHSNAVVLAMMDVSGSMGTMKKYLARSFYFWMVEFLRHMYRRVEIRFIAHTTEARLVEEDEFFHRGESGGTFCWSAYELASELITSEYSPAKWNVYIFHFSDGEDWDARKTAATVEKLRRREISMFGYAEIQLGGYSRSQLLQTFQRRLGLKPGGEAAESLGRHTELEVWSSRKEPPFIGVVIKDRDQLWPALRAFLHGRGDG